MHRLQAHNLFHIPKMMCDRCVAALTRALHAVDGTARVEADLMGRTVRVVSRHYQSALLRTLCEAGFHALSVPDDLASCHTGEIEGYVIEGHVPADAIKRLLSEKPVGKGLAVAGMPMGSPGMEMEGMAPDSYEVVLFGPSGRTTFAPLRRCARRLTGAASSRGVIAHHIASCRGPRTARTSPGQFQRNTL